MKKYSFFVKSIVCFLFFYVLQGCAVNPVTGKKELSLMSEEKEIAMGKQYDPTIVASFGLYDDPKLQAFINEKGKEMAKISHRPHLPYEFKILDSPVINAFAVPGGYVYFTRGILAHFSNEAEFAGVLGHEIGHITAKHGVRQQTTQLLSQIGLIGGVILTKGQGAQELSQAIGLLSLKYSRDHESESDKLGVEYSTEIGYDARKMANFFFTLNRMREQSGGASIPTFQSTHPDPLNRYENVNQMATAKQAQRSGQQFAVNRDSYLRMIDGLTYGEDPKQGYVEDDYFYHPDLKFKFPVPRQWRTANSPQQFQMADPDGKAMMVLMAGQGTPQEALTAFNEQQKLQVVSSENVRVNGYPAVRQIGDQQNQQSGATIRILTYIIQYGNLSYAIHGLSSSQDFATYQRTFEYTMTNFNELRDPSKINRVADQIKIEKVQRAGTLADVLRYYNMPNNRMEEIALLNSMKLTDQLSTGMLIKTVVNNGAYQPSRSSTDRSTDTTPTNTSPSSGNTNRTPSTTTNTNRTNQLPDAKTNNKPSTTSGKKKIGKIKKKN